MEGLSPSITNQFNLKNEERLGHRLSIYAPGPKNSSNPFSDCLHLAVAAVSRNSKASSHCHTVGGDFNKWPWKKIPLRRSENLCDKPLATIGQCYIQSGNTTSFECKWIHERCVPYWNMLKRSKDKARWLPWLINPGKASWLLKR